MTLEQQLKFLWSGDVERCGYILKDGSVIELDNIADDPRDNFEMDLPDDENIVATWHTHPNSCGNLSMPDYLMFLANPHLWHYIVGTAGDLRCYYVENNTVLLHESEDCP